MATKTYKPRIDFELLDILHKQDPTAYFSGADAKQWCWDTQLAVNESAHYLIGKLLEMRRGAGIWRERNPDGSWREWQPISTLPELEHVRGCLKTNSEETALCENRSFIAALQGNTRDLSKAVSLAADVSKLTNRLLPPKEVANPSQRFRAALDPLTNADSTAKDLRPSGTTASGSARKRSGQRPAWMILEAIHSTLRESESYEEFETNVFATSVFQSAKKAAPKKLQSVLKMAGKRLEIEGSNAGVKQFPWNELKLTLIELTGKWDELKQKAVARRDEAAESGDVAIYRRLLVSNCLPLPSLQRPTEQLAIVGAVSAWDYTLWGQAGQKVQSHLGWIRRRQGDRAVFELRKRLFMVGGWIRVGKDGKPIAKSKLEPKDIVVGSTSPGKGFKHCPGNRQRTWFVELQTYEKDEMPRHLERVNLAARDQPRVTRRTIKGWANVRDKWKTLVAKKPNISAVDLVDILNQLRTRNPREFSGHRIFEWLAQTEHRWLWDGTDHGDKNDCSRDDRDCVSAFAWYNDEFAYPPRSVTFTLNHATKHPFWAVYDAGNSCVQYLLERRRITIPSTNYQAETQVTRLFVVVRQLLRRNPTGKGYEAIDNVAVPLRGYGDFEQSFPLLGDETNGSVTASQDMEFTDDLLDGEVIAGSKLGGIKLIWDRKALPKDSKEPPLNAPDARVFVSFSCGVGECDRPELLNKNVLAIDTRNERDGVKGIAYFRRTITRNGDKDDSLKREPGRRIWPSEAVTEGLTVSSFDQGTRRGLVGATWKLTYSPTTWKVGTCGGKEVFAELVRMAPVSLPGDDEELPGAEQTLRDRLYDVRRKLNLNRTLLRVVRLLSIDSIEQRRPTGNKRFRQRGNAKMPKGETWELHCTQLSADEIWKNSEKAGELLSRWADTDAMVDSLKTIHSDGTFWDWIADAQNCGVDLRSLVPKTVVPSEREAREQNIDRDSRKKSRDAEDKAFADAIHSNRQKIAKALCSDYDATKRRRATGGLWAAFDDVLLKDVSYSFKSDGKGKRQAIEDGLLRALRLPPARKHEA